MELAPADVPLPFEVTFDANNLFVAMSVYETTNSMPTLVQGPQAMNVVIGNTYIDKFTGSAGRSYLIFKAVYTDGTFTVLDDNYSQGSETIVCQDIGGGGSGGGDVSIIGLVDEQNPVVGIVNC
jgi:hypothetical protein